MNDKVWAHLTSDYYSYNSNFGFPLWNRKRIISEKSETESFIKERWFCNESVNFTLTEFPTRLGKTLRIEFNPNKIMKQPLGVHLPYSRFRESIEIVESELVNYGIVLNTSLNAGRVRRGDQSYDCFTSMEHEYYDPLLKTLAPYGLRQARNRSFAETIYYGSKTTEISCYNKKIESDLDKPCLRFEYRRLKYEPKGQIIRLGDINEKRYYRDRLKDNAQILKCLFGFDPTITRAHNIEYLISMIEAGTGVSTALKLIGINTLWTEARLHGINFDSLLRRPKSDRHWRKFNALKNYLYSQRPYEPIFIERFNELKTLLRGAA